MYEKRYSNMADSERVKLESDVEDSYDIYPHPTVRVVRPNVRVIGHSSWKEALTEVTRRKAFLGFLAVLVFILLLTIVIVLMIQGRGEYVEKNQETPIMPKRYGLISYPLVSEEQIIRFKPDDFHSYKKWMDNLDDALHPYSPHLLSSDRYMQCELAERHDGKQCIFHIFDLGNACSNGHDFGFSVGKPCVLLQLNLPFHPGMVKKDSPTWNNLFNVLGTRWNPSYISVTCNGKTAKDKADLQLPKAINETVVTYYPSTGFPVAFYPSDLKDDVYRAPLVMVQFRLLKIMRPITVECIAWSQKADGTLPQSSELYRTEFKLMME